MLSVTQIILEYVCPLLGCITANVMFSAPYKDVRTAIRRGTLGNLNPTPWAFMTGNCCGWLAYSYLIQNWFVFWANAPGFIISIWLNMAAAKLQYCDRLSKDMRSSFVKLLDANRRSFVGTLEEQSVSPEENEPESARNDSPTNLSAGVKSFGHLRKTALNIAIQNIEAPAPHEKVVVAVVIVWIAVITSICFLNIDNRKRVFVVGLVVNINLLFFYGAPLSTIFEVLKTKNSSSIHRWTMIMNTLNASFWTAFGIGTTDYYILVPNGIGAVLGFIQIFLRIIIPSQIENDSQDTGILHDENDVEIAGNCSTSISSNSEDIKKN